MLSISQNEKQFDLTIQLIVMLVKPSNENILIRFVHAVNADERDDSALGDNIWI